MCFGKITLLAMLGTKVSEVGSYSARQGLALTGLPGERKRVYRPGTCAVCLTPALPICAGEPPGKSPQGFPGESLHQVPAEGDSRGAAPDILGVESEHGICAGGPRHDEFTGGLRLSDRRGPQDSVGRMRGRHRGRDAVSRELHRGATEAAGAQEKDGGPPVDGHYIEMCT